MTKGKGKQLLKLADKGKAVVEAKKLDSTCELVKDVGKEVLVSLSEKSKSTDVSSTPDMAESASTSSVLVEDIGLGLTTHSDTPTIDL